jgi:hypothetical protein
MCLKTNLNFLLDDADINQVSFLVLKETEKLLSKYNCNIFCERCGNLPIKSMVPILNISEAWSSKGIGIATSIKTALQLVKFPSLSYKIFYVWDMSWKNNENFENVHKLFNDKELIVIARSEFHSAAFINNFERKPEYTADNFENFELILQKITAEHNKG